MTRTADPYPRDMVGYGRNPIDPQWPGQARIALQFAVNYEAGGELSILHGDTTSDALLTDIGFPAVSKARSVLVESSFEFGSRRGVWRLLRLFEERGIKISVFAVASALIRNPAAAAAMVGGRPRDRRSRLAVDRLPARAGGRRAAPHSARRRDHRRSDGPAAARLDDRQTEPEHAATDRRRGRLPLRSRRPQRRNPYWRHRHRPTLDRSPSVQEMLIRLPRHIVSLVIDERDAGLSAPGGNGVNHAAHAGFHVERRGRPAHVGAHPTGHDRKHGPALAAAD